MAICTFIVIFAIIDMNSEKKNVTNTTNNTSTTATTNTTKKNTAPPMVQNIDYTQYVSIEDMDIQVTEGTTRGKAYIKIKNNSNKTLNYVRADIYFYDKDGNVVGSTYTNSGSSFLVGATQVLDRYVTWENNYDGYKVIITDAK